ncbi:hypothetical protein BS78_05G258700 [Paspalum vaginatum]|nr:hypothetical protein BS78_05G258700 [Paspalum vaginatum]
MDSIRSRFFWQGVGNKKKYHMVRWEHLARPKQFGGMGFIDTRAMNKVLLVKWLVRLDSGESNICLDLLRRKYLGGNSVAQQKKRGNVSQFWQGVMNVSSWYEQGLGWKCESGALIRFWEDVWMEECPLKLCYPNLYTICQNKNISVAEAFEKAWNFDFRRGLSKRDLADWRELVGKLIKVSVTKKRDTPIWKLEKLGKFTAKSLYDYKMTGGVDKIQSAEQLVSRKWKGAPLCKLCKERETGEHILFGCPVAVVVWCWIRDVFGWEAIPSGFHNLQSSLGETSTMRASGLVLVASVCWALWKTRNNWVFNNKLISNPKIPAYQTIGYMKQWAKMHPKSENLLEDIKQLMGGMSCW